MAESLDDIVQEVNLDILSPNQADENARRLHEVTRTLFSDTVTGQYGSAHPGNALTRM